MAKRISGLPRGHVPRYLPPADRSHLFGSHTQEARLLNRDAEAADWSGDFAKADSLRRAADHHRNEAATHGDLMPNF